MLLYEGNRSMLFRTALALLEKHGMICPLEAKLYQKLDQFVSSDRMLWDVTENINCLLPCS